MIQRKRPGGHRKAPQLSTLLKARDPNGGTVRNNKTKKTVSNFVHGGTNQQAHGCIIS